MQRKWRVEFLRDRYVVATCTQTTTAYYPEVAKDDVLRMMRGSLSAMGLDYRIEIRPFGKHPEYDKPLRPKKPQIKLVSPRPRKPSITWWTPERVDELIRLWELDLHTSDIASRMGTTKGAVCGRVHRLVQKGVLQARDGKAFSSRWSIEENKRRRIAKQKLAA